MSTLLWYPWKWEKWQADYRVTKLTWAEQGVYRALLDAAWKAGGLPNNPAQLAALARGPLPEFRRHWRAVAQFWQRRPDGLLYNTTLEEIRTEQEAAHARRVAAGRKGSIAKQRAAMPRNAQQSSAREEKRRETSLTTAGTPRLSSGASRPVPIARVLDDLDLLAQETDAKLARG